MFRPKIITIFLFFLCQIGIAQDFEGFVKYEISYVSHQNGVSVADLEELHGTQEKTFYKAGVYKSIGSSKYFNYQLFRNDHSKIYFKNGLKNDTLIVLSSLAKEEQPFGYELIENADTILGKSCHLLIVKSKKSICSYYYSPDIYCNPEGYK